MSVAAGLLLVASSASAQGSTQNAEPQTAQQRDRIGSIFAALFGDRGSSTQTLDSQWIAGRTRLANQRGAFESRVDTTIQSGELTERTGAQLKVDYYALVQIEQRYGADRTFTTQERSDLIDRYGTLSQVLADGNYAENRYGYGDTRDRTRGYGSEPYADRESVTEGQLDFSERVNAAMATRRLSRLQGSRLKADYARLVQVETGYLRDGRLSDREAADIEMQRDRLDDRVGDGFRYDRSGNGSARARLDVIARQLSTNGYVSPMRAQMSVELGDLMRLDAAYARLQATSDDRAYLDRRVSELEQRSRSLR